MSRRSGGGPSAAQQPRMSFQGGVQGYYGNPHQPQGMVRPPQQAQNYNFNRSIRMPQQFQQAPRGAQPMQFQQPPPPPPGQQPPPPQQQPPPPNSQQPLAQGHYVHQPANIMVMYQPQYRMYPHPSMYQPGVPAHLSQQQTFAGYTQPPPAMPNQIPQQRPQTPPNPAAAAAAAAIAGMPGTTPILSHGSPYLNTVVSTGGHIPPQTLAAPPPHTTQPGSFIMQPPMAKPHEKKERSRALKIVDPTTLQEVDLYSKDSSSAAQGAGSTGSTAPSEGSPAPSENVSVTTSESNENKVEIDSKEMTNATKEEAKGVEATPSSKESSATPEESPKTASEAAETTSKTEEKQLSASSQIIHTATSSSEDVDGKSKQKRQESEAPKVISKTPEKEQVVNTEAKNNGVNPEPAEEAVVAKEDVNEAPKVEKEEEKATNHVEPAEANHAEVKEPEVEEAEAEVTRTEEEPAENGTTSSATSSAAASKSSSLIKLKYEYPAEQWSPINTDGKKQYDREFLVKLANDPLSKRKPENLPSMDIIKDKPNQDKAKFPNPTNQSKDWLPGFVKSTTSKTGSNTKGGSRDNKPGVKRMGPPQVINLNINTTIELNKAENAWRPDKLRSEAAENADPLLELERNVRSILNKLTPQKFDKLVMQFNALNIDSEEKLKSSIELIFEKAVDEPEFSVAYARMCETLRRKKVPSNEDGTGGYDFRQLLLIRCQKEFLRDYMEGFDVAKYEADLAAAETEEKKKELTLEFEEKERLARRRSLGNIRFIGELYNLKMLNDKIMHEIINKLIGSIDEESLESLCWLFNTVGKGLDHSTQAKLSVPPSQEAPDHRLTLKPFDYYFSQMEKIIKTKNVTSRVRFMLQDVIDLRRNNWKPRREKAGPKTLDQIHKEAEREKTQQKLMEMQPLPPVGGGNNRGDNRGDNRKRSSRAGGQDRGGQGQGQNSGGQNADDEWNTVAYGHRSTKANFSEKIDAQKVINLAASGRKDADSMTFGPGNRMGWGKGSGSAKTQQTNRYAAIQNSDSLGAASSDATAPRRNYSASMGNFARGSGSRGSSVDERKDAIDAVKQFASSAVSSPNGPTGASSGAKNTPTPSVGSTNPSGSALASSSVQVGGPSMSMDLGHMAHMPAPSTVSEAQMMAAQTKLLTGAQDLKPDAMERRANNIVDEFVSLNDSGSALQDVCAGFHPNHMKDVAETMISHVLERSSKEMKKTGELLDFLVIKHALLPSQLANAFFAVFEMSADLEIDIPKIWENIGFIVAPVVASEKSLPLKFLLDSAAHLEERQVPKFLTHVLKTLVEIKGLDKAGEMVKRSGFSVSKVLSANKVPALISATGLDCLALPDIRSNIARLLQENPQKTDAVICWIEKNVPAKEIEEKPKDFIRTLASEVTKNSLKYDEQRSEWSLDENRYGTRCSLLKKYVDANIEREKQVLYALQHLMHEMEHPNKLLTAIFYCLYNNDVISEDGFEAWITCDDPAEELGKGVASKSTTHFFTWMRENEGEDDE